MSTEINKQIAHVLFIDIVGYSKLSINQQRAVVDELTEVVRSSDQYQKAEAADRLIKIPTGDNWRSISSLVALTSSLKRCYSVDCGMANLTQSTMRSATRTFIAAHMTA